MNTGDGFRGGTPRRGRFEVEWEDEKTRTRDDNTIEAQGSPPGLDCDNGTPCGRARWVRALGNPGRWQGSMWVL